MQLVLYDIRGKDMTSCRHGMGMSLEPAKFI